MKEAIAALEAKRRALIAKLEAGRQAGMRAHAAGNYNARHEIAQLNDLVMEDIRGLDYSIAILKSL